MRSALHFYCLIRADTFWIFSGFLRRYLRLCCLRIVIVLVLTSSDVWSKTYQFSFIFIPDIILMALCLSVHQVTLFLSPRFQNHSTCSPCTEQSSHDGEQTQSVFVFVFCLVLWHTDKWSAWSLHSVRSFKSFQNWAYFVVTDDVANRNEVNIYFKTHLKGHCSLKPHLHWVTLNILKYLRSSGPTQYHPRSHNRD